MMNNEEMDELNIQSRVSSHLVSYSSTFATVSNQLSSNKPSSDSMKQISNRAVQISPTSGFLFSNNVSSQKRVSLNSITSTQKSGYF